MKVWVTRYALSDGIEEIDAEIRNANETMIRDDKGRYFHGKDWHKDKASAILRANDMRIAKINSLRKSLEKLESMKFE